MHTLVLVKDSCEVLSFGLGANGQLGRESTSNSLSPTRPHSGGPLDWAPVISEAAAAGTLLDTSLAGGGGGGGRVLKGIYAGGDQSFATTVVQAQETMVSTCTHDIMMLKIINVVDFIKCTLTHSLSLPPSFDQHQVVQSGAFSLNDLYLFRRETVGKGRR